MSLSARGEGRKIETDKKKKKTSHKEEREGEDGGVWSRCQYPQRENDSSIFYRASPPLESWND